MTTKVKIELIQEHLPVVIESNGNILSTLFKVGHVFEAYVHSAQQLTVREMTTAELHESDPK